MTKVKSLPAWAHAEIRRMDKAHGAQKPFCQSAKIRPETFKRLAKCGCGRADVIDRVLKVIEQEQSSGGASAQQIVDHIEHRRTDIIATLSAMTPKAKKIPRMLAAFIMRKDAGLDRRPIADSLGYSSITSVNNAEQQIYDEIETNRVFRKLVYEIKGELGY